MEEVVQVQVGVQVEASSILGSGVCMAQVRTNTHVYINIYLISQFEGICSTEQPESESRVEGSSKGIFKKEGMQSESARGAL